MKTIKSICTLLIYPLIGLLLFSCKKESTTEMFCSFSLKNAQETFSFHWNLDSLDAVCEIGMSNLLYTSAPMKVLNSRDELFAMLDTDTSELSEKELEQLKKLPLHINVDFTKQSIVYFGLVGCICNRVMANVHREEDSYIIRILSYLPDEWGTNWFVDTMACSAIFPKIPTGSTFAIETIEIEGGTQEVNKLMSNERWFDIKN